MKRFKSAVLGAAITGALVYAGASYAYRKKESDESEIIWLDGMDLSDEIMPLFDVGDFVWIVSSGEYWGGEHEPIEPILYEIIEVQYDKEDETFRYKLNVKSGSEISFTETWVAEEWLDIPSKPQLSKLTLPNPETSEGEAKISAEIDYWLDTMRNSPSEKETAENRLYELSRLREERK